VGPRIIAGRIRTNARRVRIRTKTGRVNNVTRGKTVAKILKISVITILLLLFFVLAYKLLFIRVVNYEIAGIKIPSRYDIITGRATPLVNYRGKSIRATVHSRQYNKLGLTDEQVAMAQLKWALFEQWANARSEYKGWDKDTEVFKKADEEFKKELKSYIGAIKTN